MEAAQESLNINLFSTLCSLSSELAGLSMKYETSWTDTTDHQSTFINAIQNYRRWQFSKLYIIPCTIAINMMRRFWKEHADWLSFSTWNPHPHWDILYHAMEMQTGSIHLKHFHDKWTQKHEYKANNGIWAGSQIWTWPSPQIWSLQDLGDWNNLFNLPRNSDTYRDSTDIFSWGF